MRYHELVEYDDEEPNYIADEILPRLANECYHWLDEIDWDFSQYPVWRGFKGHNDKPYVIETVRLEDRKPLDSSYWVHDSVNKYFEEEFGIPFRNGSFVTNHENNAKPYGKAWYAFPMGRFEFCWSPYVLDLHSSKSAIVQRYCAEVDPKYEGDCGNIAPRKVFDKNIPEVMPYAGYQTTDLQGAISSQHEIMIWAKKMLLINPKVIAWEDIDEFLQTERRG